MSTMFELPSGRVPDQLGAHSAVASRPAPAVMSMTVGSHGAGAQGVEGMTKMSSSRVGFPLRRLLVKAIIEPSGDHVGDESFALLLVSLMAGLVLDSWVVGSISYSS